MTTDRRLFLAGAVSALAAPAIVRASSLMKIWVPPKAPIWTGWDFGSGRDLCWLSVWADGKLIEVREIPVKPGREHRFTISK